jgi:hypothetical protein
MKPIFATDLTSNKKNEKINGDEFLVGRVSSEAVESYEDATGELEDALESAKLSKPLIIVQRVCQFIGIFFVFLILRTFVDPRANGISAIMEAVPGVFIICGAALIVWLILSVLSAKKSKAVIGSTETQQTVSAVERSVDAICEELGIPDDSALVEVLFFKYVVKKDKIVIKRPSGKSSATHINLSLVTYVKDGDLCITDYESVYAIPLSEIMAIRTEKKTVILPQWKKDEKPNSPEYKEFKISIDQYSNVYVKKYHILEIDHFGKLYGLYFPSYELPIFEKLTGLKAE